MNTEYIKKLNEKVQNRIKTLLENSNVKRDDELTKEVEEQIHANYSILNSTYEDIIKELDNLIGLDDVKQEVKKLVNYLIYYKKINSSANLDKINLNMIFRGNPGTGKTTVAKIISNLLYDLGFISSNVVSETTPRDFIAGYVGQTAIKTKELIDKSKGGVIFIDEAYTFATKGDENGRSFSLEAITEIIKEMEKNETVFIFAGYSDEMDKFIDLNPGIKSRIGYDITFNDYSTNDLLKMFLLKINRTGLKIDANALPLVANIIIKRKNTKNFGNGRMIDNLYNEVIREQAFINSNEYDEDKLINITKEVVENVNI